MAFLTALLVLGAYAGTRVPGCMGAVGSDSDFLTPALRITLKLWTFMCV